MLLRIKKKSVVLSLDLDSILLKKGIDDHVFIGKRTVCTFKETTIGKYTYVMGGYIYKASIGKYCSIGYNVSIGAGRHYHEHVTTYPVLNRVCHVANDKEFKNDMTFIGNVVWIGNNAVVMDGIKVGDGAVIGAGAIVTKDVPPYAIVAGCPAKIIKMRTTQDNIDILEDHKWWDFDEAEIRNISDRLVGDIDSYCDEINSKKDNYNEQ